MLQENLNYLKIKIYLYTNEYPYTKINQLFRIVNLNNTNLAH